MRKMRLFRRPRPEAGFTMTELMIAIALLGIGMSWIVNLFMLGWQNWKRNYDELTAQQSARRAMAIMVQALREGRPGSIVISKEPVPSTTYFFGANYSRISFTDGRWRGWKFYQRFDKLMGVCPLVTGPNPSTTQFLAGDVQSVCFTFPSFSDNSLVDVALTIRKMPYVNSSSPVVVQLVERVMLRNP